MYVIQKTLSLILLACLMTSGILGCTRKTGDVTKVSFSFPTSKKSLSKSRAGKLATVLDNPLGHMVVNVKSATGTILCNWDKHGGGNGPCTFAYPTISVSVPNGQVTVQLLLAFDDQDNGGMLFQYGQADSNVTGGSADITVSTDDIGSGSIISADIHGQYFNASATPVSGILRTKMIPIAGATPVTIDEQYVPAGWFSTFSMSKVQMVYEFTDNSGVVSKWFGGPIKLDYFIGNVDTAPDDSGYAFESASSGTHAARYIADGSGDHFRVSGFFGSGMSGSLSTTTSCMTGGRYSSCMYIGQNGYTDFAGVFGKSMSGNYTSYGSGKVAWTILPGVSTSDFNQVRAYHLTGLNPTAFRDLRGMNDALDCNRVAALGIAPSATLPITSVGADNSITLASVANPGSEAYILCSAKDGKIVGGGVAYPDEWNKMSSGNNNGPYLNLDSNGEGPGRNTFARELCYPFSFGFYEGHGNTYVLPQNTDISWSTADFDIYNTLANCDAQSGQYPGTLTVPNGSFEMHGIYIRIHKSPGNYTAALSLSSPLISYQAPVFTIYQPVLRPVLPAQLFASTCYPVSFELVNPATNSPVQALSAFNFDLTLANAGHSNNFSVNPDCSDIFSPAQVSTTSDQVGTQPALYFTTPASFTPAMSLTFSNVSVGTVSSPALTFGTVAPGNQIVNQVQFKIPPTIAPGECTEIRINLANAQGSVVIPQLPYRIPVNVSANLKSQIFDSEFCDNTAKSVDILPGVLFSRFWISARATGTGTVSANLFGFSTNGRYTSPSFTVAEPTTRPFLYTDPLPFKDGQTISELEFPLTVGVHATTGANAYFSCSKYVSPGPEVACDPTEYNPSTKQLTYSFQDYMDVAEYHLSLNAPNGNVFKQFMLPPPPQLYVTPCDEVVTGPSNSDSSFTGTGPVYCMQSGAVATLSGTGVDMSNDVQIIGRADGTNFINVNGSSTIAFSSLSGSSIRLLANVTVNAASGYSGGAISIENNTDGGTPVELSYVTINNNAAQSTDLIQINNSIAFVNLHDVKITTPSTGTVAAVYVKDSNSVRMADMDISAGPNGRGLKIDNAAATHNSALVNLERFKFVGANDPLKVIGLPGYLATLQATNLDIRLNQTSPDVLSLTDFTDVQIHSSIFDKNGEQESILISGANADLTVDSSQFIQRNVSSAFFLNDNGTGTSLSFTGNHFVETQASGASPWITNSSSSNMLTDLTITQDSNFACSKTTAGWNTLVTGSSFSPSDLTMNMANRATTGKVDPTSLLCLLP